MMLLLGRLWAWAGPKILLVGAAVLGIIIAIGKIRQSGRDAEKADEVLRIDKERKVSNEIDQRVDAAGPTELERLREKWTRR